MPELPEVETLRAGLERTILGRKVVRAEVLVSKMLKGAVISPSEFQKAFEGSFFESIERRGKHLIFRLDTGYYLLLHLNMRGQLRFAPVQEPRDRYLAAAWEFEAGTELRFHDIWTWGEIRLATKSDVDHFKPLISMGAEPLSDEWTSCMFRDSLLRRRRSEIKSVLLDQTVVAGIGNIYADESLYRAKLAPRRLAGSLSAQDIAALREQIRAVLYEATANGGTVSSTYTDLNGQPGRYVPRVYDRANRPCPGCNQALTRIKIGGRGTTYCQICQQ